MRRRTLGALLASAAVLSLCHMFANTRKGEAKKKFPRDEPFCSFFKHLGLLTGRDPGTHWIDFVLLSLVISTEASPRSEIPRLFRHLVVSKAARLAALLSQTSFSVAACA